MNRIFIKRFDELADRANQLTSSKISDNDIDYNLLLNWRVKVENLLFKVCGDKSHYLNKLEKFASYSPYVDTNYTVFKRLEAIFIAAREDFEGGYLTSIRTLVQAEVFDDEIEQAKELLTSNYIPAAAVIAGVVLETALRELCDKNNISRGKLDKMNADLAKDGVYNKLMQKKITALADIRNSAAHGEHNKFSKEDVITMIQEIEQFLANQLND